MLYIYTTTHAIMSNFEISVDGVKFLKSPTTDHLVGKVNGCVVIVSRTEMLVTPPNKIKEMIRGNILREKVRKSHCKRVTVKVTN